MTADREAGIAVSSPPPLPAASSSSARAADAAEDRNGSGSDSFGDDGGGGAFDFTCIAEDVDGGGIEAWATAAFPPSAFFAVTMSENIPQFLPPNALSPPSYPTFFSPLGSPFLGNSVEDRPNKNDENAALLGNDDRREVVVVVGGRHRRHPLNKRRWAAAAASQSRGIGGSDGIRKMTRSLARGGNDRDDAEEEKKRDGCDDKAGGINEAEATNEGFEYVPMGASDDPERAEGTMSGDEGDDGAAVNGGKGGPPGSKAEAVTTATATANASTSLRRRPFADFVKTLSAARRGSGGGFAVHPSAPLKTSPETVVDRSAAEAKQGHPLPDRPLLPLTELSSSQPRLVATTAEEGKGTASGKKASRGAALLELSDDDVEIDYRTPPLGGGAFCAIHPIRLLRDPRATSVDDDGGGGDRGRRPFALKRLRRAVVESTPAMRAAAVSGLRREASLLAECSHENVVRLHGTRRRRARPSSGGDGTDDSCDEEDENFFLVLERLEETLESRLEGWSRKRRMGRFGKHYASRAAVTSRITDVALGIARGMEYLHSKNIIFRGLKPANIGFDPSGRVKLFNFGLARKCDVDPATGRPRATGRMGTLRYMAPEVADAGRRRNGSGSGGSKSSASCYTLSADVYSFALLLWQIVTSRVPYESEIPTTSVMMTVAMSKPIPDDKRPSLKYVESRELRALLERGWAARPELRPAFREVRSELEGFLLGTKSEDSVDADADADADEDDDDDEDKAVAPPPTAAPGGPPASPKVNAGSSSSLLAAPPPAHVDEVVTKPPPQGAVTPSLATAPPPSPSLADPQSASESGHIVVPPVRTGKGKVQVLELSDDDVKINYRALGSGAFCSVYPVHLKDKLTGEFDERRFALKRLRLAVLEDAAALSFAVQDLAREADILKDLRHENIIRLHGATRGKDRDESLRDGSFFIVMDVLADTLDSRLEGWAKKRRSRPLQRCTPREAVADRIRDVAVGIARGMEYLHSRDIIFRDLKPANVGFDDSGRVKIFDFGLAQKCDVDPATGSRVATGKVGTLRYMAPEVARGGRGTGNNGDDAVCYYGPSADVFSFALLLWQIVTSRVPYEKEIPATSAMMVASPRPIPEHRRPPLKYVESDDLRALLESGWASDPDVRPAFRDVGGRLRDFVA